MCSCGIQCWKGYVLRWELLELDNALGQVEHGLDEGGQGFKPRFERIAAFQNVRKLLEERHGLGERVGWVELSD
ncbi:hypothetical protein RHMOL_Rhmol12G0125100 [Rhododendron molle]|uniref:Uncharacterized protein n=1 Tax=Rhododendron molle TaxID=49168 RepID=A0ACC0LIG7_RHOML|nr:hypothetical protein RHMOL_Rhmol12G0125100 [Rhododendron molle]